MMKPYDLMTKCQQRLTDCELPGIVKLQLDISILRVKRILLGDGVETKVRLSSNLEDEFKEVYDQICDLCSEKHSICDVRDIIIRLQNLLDIMKELSNVKD